MNRRVLLPAMAALALTVGCATTTKSEPAPPAPPPPSPTVDSSRPAAPCTVISGRIALFKVDQAGNISPDCIEIDKKNDTIVVWSGLSPVESLKITFKECAASPKPDKLPEDPPCEEFACALDPKAYRQIAKKTDACYTYFVKVPGQAPKPYDPRLIINP